MGEPHRGLVFEENLNPMSSILPNPGYFDAHCEDSARVVLLSVARAIRSLRVNHGDHGESLAHLCYNFYITIQSDVV